MKERTGCQSREEAVTLAKKEIEMLDDSPFSKLAKELIQRDLLSQYKELFPQFLANDRAAYEKFRVVNNEIVDLTRQYGIEFDIGKIALKIVERPKIEEDLHICPCCNGSRVHTIQKREGKELIDESYDCKTCNLTGRLDF